MITLTYQYKLKVNRQQEREIIHILDVGKSVYNYALSERKDWLNSRKCLADRCSLVSEYIIPADEPYPNYFVQAKNLTEAKKIYPIMNSPAASGRGIRIKIDSIVDFGVAAGILYLVLLHISLSYLHPHAFLPYLRNIHHSKTLLPTTAFSLEDTF